MIEASPRQKRSKWWRIAFYLLLAGLLAAVVIPQTPGYQARQRAEVRGILQEWCRLGAFPEPRSKENVTIEGNAMTRSFDFFFYAGSGEIAAWRERSPGFKQARRSLKAGQELYKVAPQDAQRCDISIDPATGRVLISASWS